MAEHHGPDQKALEQLSSLIHQEAQTQQLGATGEFPDGKLVQDDEGELRFGVARHGNKVILNFGKPIIWIGLPKATAMQLAQALIREAEQC